MDSDKSITLGDLFAGRRDCEPGARKWESFSTPQGRKMVSFSCDTVNLKPYFERLRSIRPGLDVPALHPVRYSRNYLFVINVDQTFALSEYGDRVVWADGSTFYVPLVPSLNDAFEGTPTFDLNDIDPKKVKTPDAALESADYTIHLFERLHTQPVLAPLKS